MTSWSIFCSVAVVDTCDDNVVVVGGGAVVDVVDDVVGGAVVVVVVGDSVVPISTFSSLSSLAGLSTFARLALSSRLNGASFNKDFSAGYFIVDTYFCVGGGTSEGR